MIRNWYNQIPYPALKTKREITKYIIFLLWITDGIISKKIWAAYRNKYVINTANPFKIIKTLFLFFKHYCTLVLII